MKPNPPSAISVIALTALFLAGCSSVGVKTSMGPPENIFSAAEMEGEWLLGVTGEDERQTYHVKRLSDGALRFVTVSWIENENAYEMIEIDAQLLRIDGNPYLQLTPQTAEDPYYFYRIERKTPEELIIRPPNLSLFVAAIEEGRLSGKVNRDRNGNPSSVLLSDGPELKSYLGNTPSRPLFPAGSKWEMRATRIN